MRDWIPPAAGRRARPPACAAGRGRGRPRRRRGRAGRHPRRRRLPAPARGHQRRTGAGLSRDHRPNTSIRSPAFASGAGPATTRGPRAWPIKAALEAIRKSGIATKDIDAIIVATTTPDVAMPSTAAILQDRLSLPTVPAFDLNAACSGWLYAVAMARGMILSGMARNVLTVGVEMQSRLLDTSDRNAYFLFGDGAGAAIISAGTTGHRIRQAMLGADTRGLHMARREEPGYVIRNGHGDVDPWIRIDGHALFRFATESFTTRHPPGHRPERLDAGRNPLGHSPPGQRPHPEGRRQAQRHRLRPLLPRTWSTWATPPAPAFPWPWSTSKSSLQPGDKLVLCSVGAGMTTAAISVEW